jgi:magnesium transporter
MEAEQQTRLLTGMGARGARDILRGMSPDDRAALLDEVPAAVARRFVRSLPPIERQQTLELLGYEEGTAGRIMTPDFVDLRETMTVAESLQRIRRLAPERETIYYAYVIDNQRRLKGTVSLRELVLAEPEALVGPIATSNPKFAYTDMDQEEVARILHDYDILAVPVVDREGRLVGIVTWDDVGDVMQEEATEDIYRYGGVQSSERDYFRSSVIWAARNRIIWLLFLVLLNTVTVEVISAQENVLVEVAILGAFMPLLIATGGNIGAQSSTVIIRGIATGEVEAGTVPRMLVREMVIGTLLGLALGAVAIGWAYLLERDLNVAIIVCLTMAGTSTMAALVGTGLPFLFRAFKIDPALASAPFVTTAMDVLGVTVYFAIARLVLPQV